MHSVKEQSRAGGQVHARHAAQYGWSVKLPKFPVKHQLEQVFRTGLASAGNGSHLARWPAEALHHLQAALNR